MCHKQTDLSISACSIFRVGPGEDSFKQNPGNTLDPHIGMREIILLCLVMFYGHS